MREWGKAYRLPFVPLDNKTAPIEAANPIAYVFTKGSFIKNNRRLGIKPYIHEVGKIEAMDIDYPEDFDIANAVYKEIICKWVYK